jgi:hypothetical protein
MAVTTWPIAALRRWVLILAGRANDDVARA